MNKNAIQKYAIWARNELIEQVKQRAFQYGIDEKGYGDENASVIAGRVLSAGEKRQRRLFVDEIKKSGYNQAVEEVAYTWFNRFVALRYMEVNDFLPTHIRVFSDAHGNFNPEILANVIHLDLHGLERAKVSEYLNGNQTEELYRYLLLTQCNALNELLPEMFERMGAYAEMLLPNNILKPESVIGRLVNDIPEEDFRDAVQIIGWLYQYYITELNEIVYDGTFSKERIPKELLSAATTIYTPDWVIRYMVDNSLGKMFVSKHPQLREKLKYFIDGEPTESNVRVEDVRIFDPCMGSGHILAYAFDVLVQIYAAEGYSERDAAELILENNIYGLDIDKRAYQLAYFSLMMKARQYNRRILSSGIKPQVYSPAGYDDGEEYGSILKIDELESRPEESKESQITFFEAGFEINLNTWNFRRVLSQKYDVVVTNPPYLSSSRFSPKLLKYVNENYPEVKSDLSMVMYKHALQDLSKKNGYVAFITTSSWMFLSSFKKLRTYVLNNFDFDSLVDLGSELFDGKVGHNLIVAWVNRNSHTHKQMSAIRLVDYCYSRRDEKESEFFNPENRYTISSDKFSRIPGSPVAYWVSEVMFRAFEKSKALDSIAVTKKGMYTGDNNYFLKLWFEICNTKLFNEFKPYNKGGAFRKWYGNMEYVVKWNNNGSEIKKFKGSGNINERYFYQKCITWGLITSGKISFRYLDRTDLVMGDAGPIALTNEDNYGELLGALNSNIIGVFSEIINTSLNWSSGTVGGFPIIQSAKHKTIIDKMVNSNICLSRDDWNAFETSWDFERHPLVCGEETVAASFEKWERDATERFNMIKANEEELNSIFIDIYALEDELTPEVEDKDVTVRLADLGRDIRSLISYAVGCMLGRYSLDVDGLAYAGGEWDSSKYIRFSPDKDNILPICDDEYFDDDITSRFVDFVKTVYSADTLVENLRFIADALGGKGTPGEVIRNYFLYDFYKDHVKIYQKRPIYWLFDSGKKNGFKALIYMHRYSRDLLAKLRTDYVHEQQERYRTQLSHISSALNTASGTERAKLLKQQDKLTEQLEEITDFEEKVHHLADQNIMIDLDDGVKKNYEIFTDVLVKI